MSSNWHRRLLSNGLTNQQVGFSDSSITDRPKKVSVGVCLNFIGTKPCGFRTRNISLNNCKTCSSALFWRYEKQA